MNDVVEIDLRKVIKDLLTSWIWIVGFTLLAGAAAFLFSFLQPRTYSASALIAITRPRYLPNFDEQYQTINNNPPTNNTIIGVATSDEIVNGLYQLWQSPVKANTTSRDFLDQNLKASAGSDPTIVSLTVYADTPEQAASLANTWAQNTATKANQLYSGTGGNQVADFQAQVAAVEQNLTAAEAALTNFESRNQISTLNNQLSSLLAQQVDFLRKQRLIESTVSDVKGLVAQIDETSNGSSVLSSVQTNFLILQLRIYNDPNIVSSTASTRLANSDVNPASGSSSLQIQVPNQAPGSPITLPDQTSVQTISKDVFVSQVQVWTSTLETQSADLQTSLANLSEQINALQKQIQNQNNEKERLTQEYKNTQSVYSTLRRKLEEVKISSNDLYGNTQIASAASTPEMPDSRNIARNTVIGLMAGGFISILVVLVIKWWKSSN